MMNNLIKIKIEGQFLINQMNIWFFYWYYWLGQHKIKLKKKSWNSISSK